MSFTQADTAVNEEWVIGYAGMFRDLERGCPRQLIGFTGYERIERK